MSLRFAEMTTYQNDAEISVQTVEIPLEAPQSMVHALVYSLYSKVLTVNTTNFELMLTTTHFLKVRKSCSCFLR